MHRQPASSLSCGLRTLGREKNVAANLNDNVARMIMAGWHLCLYGIKVIRGHIISTLQLEYLYQLSDLELGSGPNVKCGIKHNHLRPWVRVSAPSYDGNLVNGEEMRRDHNIEIQNTAGWCDLTRAGQPVVRAQIMQTANTTVKCFDKCFGESSRSVLCKNATCINNSNCTHLQRD